MNKFVNSIKGLQHDNSDEMSCKSFNFFINIYNFNDCGSADAIFIPDLFIHFYDFYVEL